MNVWMNIDHRLNDTQRGKQECAENTYPSANVSNTTKKLDYMFSDSVMFSTVIDRWLNFWAMASPEFQTEKLEVLICS